MATLLILHHSFSKGAILIGDETDHCFACGKHNPDGLGLEFHFDTDTGIVQSEYTPPARCRHRHLFSITPNIIGRAIDVTREGCLQE
jgi:hypothetical protein